MSEEEEKQVLPDDVKDEFMKTTKKADISEIAETLEGKIPTEPKEEED